LTGSGENMWLAADDFQFVWKKVSAENITLTADIALPGSGGNNHRKAVLMIRQNLDVDAPYVDAALHGDGLTSLQFREEKGAVTHEIESNVSAPERLRIAKRGDRFYLWIGGSGNPLAFAGGSVRVALTAPFYVGIGVCAHNKDAIQKAVFSHVDLSATDVHAGQYSTLETIAVSSTDARVSYVTHEHIEAPEWSSDGAFLVFQVNGKTQRVPVAGGIAETVEAAGAKREAADDSRVSPDGRQIAVLSHPTDGDTVLSVGTKVLAKLAGGRGTLGAHPWSPDSKRLTFVSYQSIQ
jgi:hypothetical protein